MQGIKAHQERWPGGGVPMVTAWGRLGPHCPRPAAEATPEPCTRPRPARWPPRRVSLAEREAHPRAPPCRLLQRGTCSPVRTPRHSEGLVGAGLPLAPPRCPLTHPPPALRLHPWTLRGASGQAGSSPSRGRCPQPPEPLPPWGSSKTLGLLRQLRLQPSGLRRFSAGFLYVLVIF